MTTRKQPGTDWVTDSIRRRSALNGSRRAQQLADRRVKEERQAAEAALALPRIVIEDGSSEK